MYSETIPLTNNRTCLRLISAISNPIGRWKTELLPRFVDCLNAVPRDRHQLRVLRHTIQCPTGTRDPTIRYPSAMKGDAGHLPELLLVLPSLCRSPLIFNLLRSPSTHHSLAMNDSHLQIHPTLLTQSRAPYRKTQHSSRPRSYSPWTNSRQTRWLHASASMGHRQTTSPQEHPQSVDIGLYHLLARLSTKKGQASTLEPLLTIALHLLLHILARCRRHPQPHHLHIQSTPQSPQPTSTLPFLEPLRVP